MINRIRTALQLARRRKEAEAALDHGLMKR